MEENQSHFASKSSRFFKCFHILIWIECQNDTTFFPSALRWFFQSSFFHIPFFLIIARFTWSDICVYKKWSTILRKRAICQLTKSHEKSNYDDTLCILMQIKYYNWLQSARFYAWGWNTEYGVHGSPIRWGVQI